MMKMICVYKVNILCLYNVVLFFDYQILILKVEYILCVWIVNIKVV